MWYGSVTRDCIYTENTIYVPKQLVDKKIILTKSAYVAIGYDDKFSCLNNLKNINRKIISSEDIDNGIGIGRDYYEERGAKIQELKTDISFSILKIIAVTKHGMSTMDSGSGPMYYLISKDLIIFLFN